MIVGWAGFICPPFQCLHALPAWAVKACPPYKMIILSINTSRLAARLFICSYNYVATTLELTCLITWDEKKSRANLKKHGVTFESAQLVFQDPLHLSRQERIEDGELRWQTLGIADGVVLLLVAHTWRETDTGEEHIRIISARRATRKERTIYEQGA